ncbi:complexin-3-like [Synchiropus splendidus]|uniref:complexin-3-like n=1 Tax=Synchiropus splendidus TaxID=270530 RepID=UPI00237EE406|nr:complexin-3-like [Synchiropus splendidus]
MESVVRLKRTLRTPIRRLTSCVTTVKERRLCAKRRNRSSGRGGCNKLKKSPPPRAAYAKDASIIRSYRADLEKERRQREATNTQKNAERAAMRAHFRRKYNLSENTKDTNHLRSVGGKVSLPRELARIIHPQTKAKDDRFNLLSAFQGLGLGGAALSGNKTSRATTPTPAPVRACKVM